MKNKKRIHRISVSFLVVVVSILVAIPFKASAVSASGEALIEVLKTPDADYFDNDRADSIIEVDGYKPILNAPMGTINNRTPDYEWEHVSGANEYELQLKTGPGAVVYTETYTNSVCTSSTCTATPSTELAYFTTYKWKVRARVGGQWKAFSDLLGFNITDGLKKDWTFMVYLAADNNLEPAGVDDFLEMATVGSTDHMNVIVQFDRSPSYSSDYGDWTDTNRYYITKGMTPEVMYAHSALGEVNMGDEATLEAFVNWSKSNFPAKKYALILWNHGGGWMPSSDDSVGSAGVGWDDSSGDDYLSNEEVSSALSATAGANKFELLGFDACLMAQLEVMQHVKDYTKFGVGSEQTEPFDGWPFDKILKDLKTLYLSNGATLGKRIVYRYYQSYGNDETQSAVRYGEKYTTLMTKFNTFVTRLREHLDTHRDVIADARSASISFEEPDFIDLSDFVLEITNRTSSTDASTLHSAAKELKKAIKKVVIKNLVGSSYADAKGISIYFPESDYSGSDANTYETTQWLARDTDWDQFLSEYHDYLFTITLSWNAPTDLDSHLWLPVTNQFHVKWNTMGQLDAFPFAMLDAYWTVPENITIASTVPGQYEYKVYQWSGEDVVTLKNSKAVVRIYRHDTLIKTMKVKFASGVTDGRWWRVFKYNADTDTFTWQNILADDAGAPYDNSISAAGVRAR